MAMADVWRWVRTEYFGLNLFILATYVFFRFRHQGSHVDIKAPFTGGKNFVTLHSASFVTVESQVAASLLLTAVARSYRSPSTYARMSTILGYSQLFVLINTALSDIVACVCYLVAFGLVFLLWNEPSYDGPDKVEVMTPDLLNTRCLKDVGDGVAYAVFLYAPWSSRCRHSYPLFAELSNRYATDKLKFAKLDVATWPRVAGQLSIELSATSSALPTVIAFEGGQEVGRVPTAASRSGIRGAAKWTFSKLDMINALQLDARYAKSMGKAASSSAS